MISFSLKTGCFLYHISSTVIAHRPRLCYNRFIDKKHKNRTLLLVLAIIAGILITAAHFVNKKNERLRAEQKTIVDDVVTIEESRLDELAPRDHLIDAVIEARVDPNKSFKIIRRDDTAEWQEGLDC